MSKEMSDALDAMFRAFDAAREAQRRVEELREQEAAVNSEVPYHRVHFEPHPSTMAMAADALVAGASEDHRTKLQQALRGLALLCGGVGLDKDQPDTALP